MLKECFSVTVKSEKKFKDKYKSGCFVYTGYSLSSSVCLRYLVSLFSQSYKAKDELLEAQQSCSLENQ